MRTTNINERNSRFLEYQAFRWMMSPDEHDISFARKKLKKAVNEELTTKQKEYIYAYYVECKTMEEIAAEKGVNKSTVSRTLKRARCRLQRVMKYTSIKFL